MSVGQIVRLVVGLVVGLAVMSVVVQIEDWGRDFSQNTAQTDPESPDPRLRPVVTDLGFEAADAAVLAAVEALPGWAKAEGKGPLTGPGRARERYFTRTTPVFRFVDDITVRVVSRDPPRCEIEIRSKSRVGKGDLGQNPRNVRMLHYRIEQELVRIAAER